ncbi:hypothetical protein A2716_04770 [candidate division WWE3 bacterium RIFCSPHIGHO2_01_FULL_40_23]|uniref:Endolytic murein transglycosylase n=1 Tax=candidate division WWE3 bacterium RIFCSPLOWO2_01_FULL_41_18 TaxID=1802625 RepID=A0A1F4VER0_UNCKA|nr:MAG: hypothetical protein A2716_04770 [candidate division WWE3 bacterium RIFCSPHIGHO2_01_FULL_40_23]OGC55183.1 MAG: hypothetical protein A3A78_04380 [candidate division WWE3 bacterium RIFCSPLOWO2_01_FULL_41_18]
MRNKLYKKIAIFIISFIFFSGLAFAYYKVAVTRKNYNGSEPKTIIIEEGMATSDIAKLLRENRLINSSSLFVFYARINNFTLQAGTYTLPSDLAIPELALLLTHGTNDIKVTIVEGLRAEEIAQITSSKFKNVNYEKFMSEVISRSLEGKLFPDTYLLDQDISTEELIKLLTDTFDQKTKDLFSGNKTKLSMEEILILSSIVEREEPEDENRPVVAGILINRYNEGALLGADATVQYIFGTKEDYWPKNLTSEQLQTESPYNTRKVLGLPPKPICNPSLSAVKAVLSFKETVFRYYLHDKDGKVRFAKTLEEHEANKVKYL